ncbi:MAG: hypothetical protein JKX73_08665, partial [Flavobacteriales bacterium]|nr:hypothetical protein [Flavobacteriales bacterium]
MMKISKIKLSMPILSYCLAVLAICSLVACTQPIDEATKMSVEITPSKVQTVEVVNPAFRSFNAELHIVGTAMPNQQVMVHAMEG